MKIKAKKSLGQNFLIDKNILKKISDLILLNKNSNIVEIGPGTGALTEFLIRKKTKNITIIEKDFNLAKNLKKKFNEKVKVINEDILKFNDSKIFSAQTVVCGNLPYNISSQILVNFILNPYQFKFEKLIFMFQKEMAERIIGKYGTKKYGRLSILTNYKLNVLKSFDVSPNCFFPVPRVLSTVISFRPKTKVLKIKKMQNLEKISNILFSGKRKMINKNMKKLFNKKDFDYISNNIELNLRPSELKPEIFYKITEFYEKVN